MTGPRPSRPLIPSRIDVLRLSWLAVTFALPATLASALWPHGAADAGGWKVAAIMAGATLFMAMKAFYAWTCLRQTQLESEEAAR